MGWFQNALCLWNIGKTISSSIHHTFTASLLSLLTFCLVSSLQFLPWSSFVLLGGFLFFTWVWPLTGLPSWVIVRSSFFCQSNRVLFGFYRDHGWKGDKWLTEVIAGGWKTPWGMAGKCVWLCVSVCLLWLSDRTTPILLYGPIGPSLGCGSVICHVGMCVCVSHLYYYVLILFLILGGNVDGLKI